MPAAGETDAGVVNLFLRYLQRPKQRREPGRVRAFAASRRGGEGSVLGDDLRGLHQHGSGDWREQNESSGECGGFSSGGVSEVLVIFISRVSLVSV